MSESIIKTIILILLVSNTVIISQNIIGQLVDENDFGLAEVNVELYIYPNVYETKSNVDGTFSFILTNVSDELLPTGYEVSNNYPNPFNPITRFSISLAKDGFVQVAIFNVLGQNVGHKIERQLNAGINFVDIELDGLPNGLYIARININNTYSVNRKIMLLYGSQHLNTAELNMSKSNLMKAPQTETFMIDSLIATSKIIGRHTFNNFSHDQSDLGKLSIPRYCLETPIVEYGGIAYNTVKIGDQCWLKKNLNVGNMINNYSDPTNNQIIEKHCYDNDENNCEDYGALYQWDEAMYYVADEGSRGICPEGWHIPTKDELQILVDLISGSSNALKEVGQGIDDGNGTNLSGFNALLTGYKAGNSDAFSALGLDTYFWSSSESSFEYADYLHLRYNNDALSFANGFKPGGFCVRCIRD